MVARTFQLIIDYSKITDGFGVFVCILFFGVLVSSPESLAQKNMANSSGVVKEYLVKDRPVTVYLPPNYSTQNRYQVVFFHDGQDLFATRGWNLREALDRWIQNQQIAPIIIVGIHSSARRTSELVPYRDPWISKEWGAYEPQADGFSTFLWQEVRPWLQQRFSVSSKGEDYALFGASFGGLNAIWQGATFPGRWGMVAGLSPSCWVADHVIFKTAQQAEWGKTKVWLDIGTAEWNYYVPLLPILRNHGLSYGKDFFYYEVPGGRHLPVDWRARVIYPLIAFAGPENHRVVQMEVVIERIPSQRSQRVYLRINPILTTSSGIRFSAVDQAIYKVLNPTAGEVKADGRFRLTGDTDLRVQVSYGDFLEVMTIKP